MFDCEVDGSMLMQIIQNLMDCKNIEKSQSIEKWQAAKGKRQNYTHIKFQQRKISL